MIGDPGRQPVALLALFLAVGGTSYAASTALLPRNSVATAQVIDHSLLAKDFKRGQVPKGARGVRGPLGALGLRGATGVQGPAGANPAVAAGTDPTPPASPTTTYQTLPVTTSSSARLFVQGRVALYNFACTSGAPCTVVLGLYVDGQPVPGGGLEISSPFGCGTSCDGTSTNPSVFGLTAPIPAGSHTVTLSSKATVGSVSSSFVGLGQLTAMVLG